jgi:hypothetical protein
MNDHSTSPLIQLLTQFREEARATSGEPDVERLRSLVERALHVEVSTELLRNANSVAALAEALKEQVDHPGRLERVAERLLGDGRHAGAA